MNYKTIKVEGNAWYKTIKSVEFKPLKEIEEMEVVVPKGKIFWWRLFGLIPLIPIRAKCDLYEANFLIVRFVGLEEAFETKYQYQEVFLKDNIVYSKARVYIYSTENRNDEYRYFETNEEAMKYFEHIKEKCQECGNHLK